MKTIIRHTRLLLFLTGTFVLNSAFTCADGDRVKVYLQNDCSSDVKIKVESPGSSTRYSIPDGTKKPMTFLVGTKIYDAEDHLVHTISEDSEGKTIVVCD